MQQRSPAGLEPGTSWLPVAVFSPQLRVDCVSMLMLRQIETRLGCETPRKERWWITSHFSYYSYLYIPVLVMRWIHTSGHSTASRLLFSSAFGICLSVTQLEPVCHRTPATACMNRWWMWMRRFLGTVGVVAVFSAWLLSLRCYSVVFVFHLYIWHLFVWHFAGAETLLSW